MDREQQVFGITPDGKRVIGSAPLEDIFNVCQECLPVRDLYAYTPMEEGGFKATYLGKVFVQFAPHKVEEPAPPPPPPEEVTARESDDKAEKDPSKLVMRSIPGMANNRDSSE